MPWLVPPKLYSLTHPVLQFAPSAPHFSKVEGI